jgi:hypothetical protein
MAHRGRAHIYGAPREGTHLWRTQGIRAWPTNRWNKAQQVYTEPLGAHGDRVRALQCLCPQFAVPATNLKTGTPERT